MLKMKMKTKTKPRGLEWRSSTSFILGTVGISCFTDLFLYALVIPLLPFILQDRLHLEPGQLQIHVSALLAIYAGASFLFSPLAGLIADRGSTRRLSFLLGLTALLFATLLLLLGRTFVILAVGRGLQGISAAVVWTVGLALLFDTVGPDDLGKTMGSIFSFISVGELAAPVLGGILYKKTGYIGVFALGSGLLAVDFILRLLLIEKSSAAKYIEPNEIDDNSQRAEGDMEEGSEGSEEDALLGQKEDERYKIGPNQRNWVKAFPVIYCLKNPRLVTALFLTMVSSILLGTFDATIPTVAVDLFHLDSLQAGLLFITLVIPYLIFGPIAGWLVDRYGTKPIAVFGFSCLVPGLILLRLVQRGGKSEIIQYCGILTLCGTGMAFSGAPSLVESSFVVTRYHKANPGFFGAQGPYAQLYALSSMAFSVGLTLGPLASGALKEMYGYGNMNAVLAGICLFTAGLSVVWVGDKPMWLRSKGV